MNPFNKLITLFKKFIIFESIEDYENLLFVENYKIFDKITQNFGNHSVHTIITKSFNNIEEINKFVDKLNSIFIMDILSKN